jgi:hypothetical protein
MLDILELLARALMGLLRVASIFEYIVEFFLGAYWLISPRFREKVRSHAPINRFAVYSGAVSIALLAVGAVFHLAFGDL